MQEILNPLEVLFVVLMELSDEESDELLRYADAGPRDVSFCERATEWIIKWKARQSGGGVG